MKVELSEKLITRFNFYTEKDIESNYGFWGFECGDGWFDLLWKLSEELEKANFSGKVEQVKEKFGSLRFYVDASTKEQDKIISKYEKLSYTICEKCGEKGDMRTGGWLKVLCDKCYNKNKV